MIMTITTGRRQLMLLVSSTAVVVVLALTGNAEAFQTAIRPAGSSSVIAAGSRRSTISTTASRSTVLVQSYNDDEELPKFSSDIVVPQNDDGGQDNKEETSTTKTKKTNNKQQNLQLLDRFNEIGLSLKPKAYDVNLQANEATKQKRKIGLKVKACLYYTLYMAYRGYRGCFVILPAVFREVYKKMETAVDFRVLDDDDNNDNDNNKNAFPTEGDLNPETGKIRWRTKITVSVLAGIVTTTYVIGGLARVLMKFIKTILSTSSLSGSFSAAADEVEGNEGRLLRLSGGSGVSSSINESSSSGVNNQNINGKGTGQKDLGF